MSPETAAKKAAGLLMYAVRSIEPDREIAESEVTLAHTTLRSGTGQKFLLVGNGYTAVKRAALKLAPVVDSYPLDDCERFLQQVVSDAAAKNCPPGEMWNFVFDRVRNFVHSFQSLGQWEVAIAVRGIDPSQNPFTVGPCAYSRMNQDMLRLWGRRLHSGQYNPPVPVDIGMWEQEESGILNSMVATVRVHVIDHRHAQAKARQFVEETLNLLRFGQLCMNYPAKPFPEVGLEIEQFVHDHYFCVRLDSSGGSSGRHVAGPVGNDYSISRRAPGWDHLDRLLCIEAHFRTEIQIRIVAALQWVGRAALAPSLAVRLVSTVTAMEALLLEDSEQIGKRNKLKSRIGLLIGSDSNRQEIERDVYRIYGLRSRCVHGAEEEVDPRDTFKAVTIVAETINALISKAPYPALKTIDDVIKNLGG